MKGVEKARVQPHFTKEHRRQLRHLGVTVEQIEALDKRLLHIRLSAQTVPTDAIRQRLQAVADASHALAVAIKRVHQGTDPADSAASWPLAEAHSDRLADDHIANPTQARYPDNSDPDTLRHEIERLEEVANAATAKLYDKRGRLRQSRARLANPQPISWIEDALLRGWGETYTEHLSDDDLRKGRTGKPLPMYPFGPSKGGPFREIVCICYQAAAHPTEQPDRAIRNYLKRERERFGRRADWVNGDTDDTSWLHDDGDTSP